MTINLAGTAIKDVRVVAGAQAQKVMLGTGTGAVEVWRPSALASSRPDYWYPLDYTGDSYVNVGSKSTRLEFESGGFADRTKYAYVAGAKPRINVAEPWNGVWSFAAWFERTGNRSATEYLFSRGDSTRGTCVYVAVLQANKANLAWQIDDGKTLSSWVFRNGVIPMSGWFHFAISSEVAANNGNKLKFYVNGQVIHESFMTPTIRPLSFASSDWASAGNSAISSAAHQWEGNVDDIAIWSRALTDAEVSEIYSHGRSA